MIKKYYNEIIIVLACVSCFYCIYNVVSLFNLALNESSIYSLIINGLLLGASGILLYLAFNKKLDYKNMILPAILFFVQLIISYTFYVSDNKINFFTSYSTVLWILLSIGGLGFYVLATKNEKIKKCEFIILSILLVESLLSIFNGNRKGIINFTLLVSFIYSLYLNNMEEEKNGEQ